MKEKIEKALSSKSLVIVLSIIHILLALGLGGFTFGQKVASLLGTAIAIFILFSILQAATDKKHNYCFNIAVIFYWVIFVITRFIF